MISDYNGLSLNVLLPCIGKQPSAMHAKVIKKMN